MKGARGAEGGEGGRGGGPAHGLLVLTGVSCEYKDIRQILKPRLR